MIVDKLLLSLAYVVDAEVRLDGTFNLVADPATGTPTISSVSCLEMSTSNEMGNAVNPNTGEEELFHFASWKACDADNPDQWFEYDVNGNNEISLNEGTDCLTAMALNSVVFENLDSCDVQTGFSGAGAHLYLFPCNDTLVDHQDFMPTDTDSLVDVLQSACPHGFFLGMTTSSGYAILTAEATTLPSAVVVQGLEIEEIEDNTFGVRADRLDGADDVLSELLSTAQYAGLIAHGCFCTHFDGATGNKILGGSETLDALDFICKRWTHVRKCNELTGGSCAGIDLDPRSYNMSQSIPEGELGCETGAETFVIGECLADTCVIDSTFVEEILEFFEANPTWVPIIGDSVSCVKSGGGGGGGSGGTTTFTHEQTCIGVVPDLHIERL